MPRRATGHYDNALGLQQLPTVVYQCRKRHVVALYIDAPAHAVPQTLGLLEYLLQHEVRIAAFLYLSKVNVHLLHCQLLFFAKNAHHLRILSQTNHGNVSILQIDHLVCVLNDGTGVRAQKELILSNTHNQGTLFACSHYLVGVATVNNGNGIGAYHLIEGYLHSLQQRQLFLHHNIFYQLYQYFGVGITLELNPLSYKFLFDVSIVFYDTIMDNG